MGNDGVLLILFRFCKMPTIHKLKKMKQNYEEIIMMSYVWSLYSSGETKEEAEKIAGQNINRFKKAEGDEIRADEGHNNPIPVEQLAEYVAGKYLTSLDSFIKEAESKETLLELEDWWQKHQNRVSMNLSKDDFSEFAMKTMFSLRSKFDGGSENDPSTVSVINDEEKINKVNCTDLIVDIRPGEMVSSNFSSFAKFWGDALEEAKKFIPQSEDDLKRIREHEKACRDVENKISEVIEKALMGNPKIQSLVEGLKELGGKTRASRIDAGKIASEWMEGQKKQAVEEHLARVKDAADKLFVGEIAKGRNDADTKGRLVASYKGKRTVGTIITAVEEEAGRIIEEMNDLAARCRSNLKLIEESGHPALFQDKENLMTWEQERLEQQIKLRVQQDELLKAKAKRAPEKLAEWKATVSEIDNVPHLDNWYLKHWGEVKESLTHEDDQAELLKFCGEHKQKLKSEYAKSANSPPPPEDPPQGHGDVHFQPDDKQHEERHEESAPPATDDQGTVEEAVQEEPELINLEMSFCIFGTRKDAKKIAGDVYNLIGKNPMLQEDENGNKITLRRI